MGTIKLGVVVEQRVRREYTFEVPDDYAPDDVGDVIQEIVDAAKHPRWNLEGEYKDGIEVRYADQKTWGKPELVGIHDL